MAHLELLPLITFIVTTSFSPGPNNISSAALATTYGYKKTLPYLLGIMTGFFIIMLLCSFISTQLMASVPKLESYLVYVGAAYISWLAVSILKSSSSMSCEKDIKYAFIKGAALQVLNPKAIIYGLTLFTTFLVPISDSYLYLTISSLLLCITTFIAISTWAIFGAIFRDKMQNPSIMKATNITLSCLLFYTAISLVI